VGLLLQSLLLGHGGLTTLGVNAVLMGVPALLSFGVYQLRHLAPRNLPESLRFSLFSGLAGMVGLGLSALIFFSLILFTIPAGIDLATEKKALTLLLIAHIPLMFIEGGFTIGLGSFLRRIKPELVEA
jgi:cobalt/nickel transport system permease protein